MVLQRSYFLAFLDYFQRGQKRRNVSRKWISILNYEQFISNLNNYLKDELPNGKLIADHINDFLNDLDSQFSYKNCI